MSDEAFLPKNGPGQPTPGEPLHFSSLQIKETPMLLD